LTNAHITSRPDPIGQVTYANQVSEGQLWMVDVEHHWFFNGWKDWQIPWYLCFSNLSNRITTIQTSWQNLLVLQIKFYIHRLAGKPTATVVWFLQTFFSSIVCEKKRPHNLACIKSTGDGFKQIFNVHPVNWEKMIHPPFLPGICFSNPWLNHHTPPKFK